ncbi:hypothetical protein [Pseudomonas saliphila]|uniref:hypothetical protein n=1 Tax=Pseudomonas saliphila TaxID=2586906 RepID=UPI00123BCCC4|nr:hypothetical protein [Pseudomonas saliphila]
MAATLRLATLNNGQFQLHEQELQQVCAELPRLDALCKSLGVIPLSQFVDVTALEFREAGELLDDQAPERIEPDPLTGLAYGLEDMSWSPVAVGMTSVEALTGHLQRNRPRELPGADIPALAAELHYCEQMLAPLEPEGAQFHLAAD